MTDDVAFPGAPRQDLGATFLRLQGLLVGFEDVEAFLQQVTRLASEVLVDQDTACGITMRYDGQPWTVASSDVRAVALDETQYQASSGPCLHTLATGQVTDIPDTEAETRWADYLKGARREGLRCSLSLPLAWDGTVLGAMNMYGFTGTGVFAGHERTFEVFAAQASGSLWLARQRADSSLAQAQLETALASRTVVDQAMGILMGQQRCTADEAFSLLRMASQRDNRKLRDVAADLVTRVSGQQPQAGRAFE